MPGNYSPTDRPDIKQFGNQRQLHIAIAHKYPPHTEAAAKRLANTQCSTHSLPYKVKV